ncbi:MAG TPA: hypothetical protein VNU97_04685 [Rhizomicrobium sp.]|jgi:hypothetical protein|nr:hypothetical protein [Rhizomicrobium sp.]
MKFRTLMMSAALILAAGPAFAAPPSPPLLVRGTIASIDAKSVTIAKADGTTVTGALAPTTFYAAVEPRRFDQIKATDFVGITSVPGPNDTLKAEEIHILPIHVGEGSYPWDHHPDGAKTAGSMTNGTVAVVHGAPTVAGSMTNGTVTTSDGWSLKVTYHGSAMVNGKCVGLGAMGGAAPCTGVAAVAVSPSTPIVAIVPAKPGDAKAGLAVFANMANGPDGKPVVGSLVLEKNGIKPQM